MAIRSAKRKQTTIYLEPVQLARLARLAAATRVPMAEYIRDGVELVLAREEERLRRIGRVLPPIVP